MEDKILVIDDNKELIDCLYILCRKENLPVYFMTDPRKVLSRKDLMSFTQIVVDLHMCPLNGDDFIEKYKQMGGKAKLILCTSYITKGDSFLGADDGLRKPFTMDQFKQILGIS